MKAERKNNAIVVHLSADETLKLQDGQNVGGRFGVTSPDAKITVWPLNAIANDDSLKDLWSLDRLEKASKASLEGRLDIDGDLALFVPAIKFSDVRISSASLPKEEIKTPGVEGEDRKTVLARQIPEKGIIVNFGGSLKEVDVNTFSYKE